MNTVLSIKQQLEQAISAVCGDLDLDLTGANIAIDRPADPSHGDWASNVAMVLAGKLGKNPRQLAEQIVAKLNKGVGTGQVPAIESVGVAGPGFINFKLKSAYYQEFLTSFASGPAFIPTEQLKRIMVECGDPNTHKMPHIGHLYSYIIGNSISKIMEFTGNEVCLVNYQGDVGPHVAKCIYGWIQKGRPDPEDAYERVKLLQQCYQEGARLYEEDEAVKEEVSKINKAIYDPTSEVQADWQTTRQWSLDYYLIFEKELGIDQKFHYLESQIWQKGMELVKANTRSEANPKGVFVESDGAIIFPGEDYGLHTRVFITRASTPTYECKELGLNTRKMADWPYDLTIIPTGGEQIGYFKVVIKAIEEAIPELKGKIQHIGFGMVNLSTGKMSSRTGQILSAPDLIDLVKSRVAEVVADREGLSEEQKLDITRKVALAAIKYAFLKGNVMQNMTFDLEESVSFEGNSGPYLLYTYARIQSLLKEGESVDTAADVSVLDAGSELAVLKKLESFRENVIAAKEKLAPHIISTYLYELAQDYNSFYKQLKINSAPDAQKSARRLLSQQVGRILHTGLALLGIETVEKM